MKPPTATPAIISVDEPERLPERGPLALRLGTGQVHAAPARSANLALQDRPAAAE